MKKYQAEDYCTELPCGKKINQDKNRHQCCRTECPNKDNYELEVCFTQHKNKAKKKGPNLEGFGEELPDTSGKHRLFYH